MKLTEKKPKIIEKVSVSDTLLAMDPNQVSIFSTSTMKILATARAAARLKAKKLGAWSISTDGLSNKIQVTRIS